METKEVNSKSSFTLPNKTVTVKFIPRKKGMASEVPDNHVIAGGMLQDSKKRYFAPLQRNGAIANVLTNEEKEYLEKVTGFDLSVYGDFWTTFSVSLYKEEEGNKFDLSNPIDYIQVAILKACKQEIAQRWEDRKKRATYQFVIVEEGEINSEKKVKLDSKKEAFKLYGKIEDDRDKLIGVLKLLTNKPISKDAKLDWIQGRVEEYVDTMPTAFLDIVNDEAFDTKILINKGLEAKVLIRKGNKYSTVDGLELCEDGEFPTFENVVRYLDNPKYQDVRSLIEAKINKANEK